MVTRERLRHAASAACARPAATDTPFAIRRSPCSDQGLDQEHEREDQQPDQEGQQEFADNIAVEDPEHLRVNARSQLST